MVMLSRALAWAERRLRSQILSGATQVDERRKAGVCTVFPGETNNRLWVIKEARKPSHLHRWCFLALCAWWRRGPQWKNWATGQGMQLRRRPLERPSTKGEFVSSAPFQGSGNFLSM